MSLNPDEALGKLREHLHAALSTQSARAEGIRRFLDSYDALPDEIDAFVDARWEAIHQAAYELRWYAPEDARTDSALLDDAAAIDRIQQTLAQSA